MKALDRKLWRDLGQMKSQALAIALVVTCGVATFIMFLSTLAALRATQESFYRDYRFAEVFATLKRAPESLRLRVQDILVSARSKPGWWLWCAWTCPIFPSRFPP